MPATHNPSPEREGALGRLAEAMFVRRRRVLAGWLAVLVLAVAGMTTLGGTFTADYNTPGSGSAAASDRLAEKFAGRSGDSVDIVWQSQAGADSAAVTDRVDRLLERASTIEGVVPGTTTEAAEVAPDGRTAIVRLPLDRASGEMKAASGEHLRHLLEQTSGDGLKVAANGAISGLNVEPGMSAEFIGLGVAAIVLLLAFGTVIAAGLPLLTALLGVGVAVMSGGVLAAVVDTPDWAVQVSVMIGLGVGIDYALLILMRYRSEVARGLTPQAAVARAMSTAGHAVLVAGATVVIALMGLFLMRLSYLNGVALAASLTVLTVLAATATLLPALIGFSHKRIASWPLGRLAREPKDLDRAPGARWARVIDRRPLVATVASLVLLAVLASPLAGIRFGFPDAGNDPADATTRQAYDMVADGFGPGANGPLIAVATTETSKDRAAIKTLTADIGRDPAVVSVAPPQFNDTRDTAMLVITPEDAPASASTEQLVKRLREGPLADAPMPVDLGGATAATVDQSTVTANRLPLFIGAVVGLSFLLLLGAFRAPIIAAKAGLMTVLSIAASYGIVALAAEGGWFGRLVGIDTDLPVPPFIPVMMFAVLFGLSMDYEVFLVSRIKEERERLRDARAGVSVGLARTSKVILAAALIMFSVFGAFVLSHVLVLKLIGLGLASAILIDAIVVRMVLVPALMRLLGERAWWTPGRSRTETEAPASRPATAAV